MFVTAVFIMVLVGPGPPVLLISRVTAVAGILTRRRGGADPVKLLVRCG